MKYGFKQAVFCTAVLSLFFLAAPVMAQKQEHPPHNPPGGEFSKDVDQTVKRSVTADLRTPLGVDIVKRLARTAPTQILLDASARRRRFLYLSCGREKDFL